MSEIEELWEVFLQKPYPNSLTGEEIDGVELTQIDTFAAGCIQAFIANKNTLDSDRQKVLQDCMSDIDKVFDKLGDEGKEYFSQLYKLGYLVQQELE
jgi:hypothetical protein